MAKKKSKLESLTSQQIEEITTRAEQRDDVPLVKSSQVNMRLSEDILEKIKELAQAQNIPYTTFLTKLLKEDVDRLWSVYKKSS
jgi:predicted DNA binding CopG/RHH family protein